MTITPSKPCDTVGTAYLVGAGPGDPELLTLKAKRILETSDVVLYDYLVDSRIMDLVPSSSERIYVGKSGVTGHTMSQQDIEQLIVDKCQQGLSVCRLKGGDPYVFGRGGEEGQTLKQHGIPFQVIPGITSAIAAPAYAGIPVTHRDVNSCFCVITGHEDPTKPNSQINWASLAGLNGTLIFLMGVKQLSNIVQQLQAHGMSPETPIALVHWGTRPEQQTLVATLATIEAALADHPLPPPCIIVVGEVVGLRPELNWFETLPLFGRRMIITRARTQASGLRRQLENLGAQVLEFPTLAFEPPLDPAATQAQLRTIPQADWVVFTSPNGVDSTFALLKDAGLDARHFHGTRLASIGPATAERLAHYGLTNDLLPERFVAESLADALIANGVGANTHVVCCRADIARDALVIQLETAGATVNDITVYRTVSPDHGDDIDALIAQLEAHEEHLITFTSSSTVDHFMDRLGHREDLLRKLTLASIGPITSQTLVTRLGRPADIEANVYTIPGLIDAIIQHYGETTPRELSLA